MPNIYIKNITAVYENDGNGPIEVFNDLSVTFESYKFNVVLGFSGCGKTTLLNCITGTKDYFDGHIYFDNLCVDSLDVQKRNISIVKQDYAIYPTMNVFDNIAFPLKVGGAKPDEIRARVVEIAKTLDIDYLFSRKPKELSGGQCQRVALARALVKKPSIILLDEPLSNLDEINRKIAMDLLKDLNLKYATTIVYVTHNINEALMLANKIFIFDEGKLIEEGTPKEIIESTNETILSLINARGSDER